MTDWLPELLYFEDYDGDWHHYEDALYEIFCIDFIHTTPLFDGKRIGIRRTPSYKEREWSFWHIIGEGPEETERNPDMRRCERIRFPRAIISDARSRGLKCWASDRNDWKDRILIALPDFSYMVVLVDKLNYLLILTAYCIETEKHRGKLANEWKRNTI